MFTFFYHDISISEAILFSDHFGNPLEFEPAPLTYRGAAYCVDRVILAVFWILLIAGAVYLSHTSTGAQLSKSLESSTPSQVTNSPPIQILVTIFIVVLAILGYALIFLPVTLCEYFFKGISPGKFMFGLRIESTNGEAPSFIQILIRSLIRDIEGTVGIIFIMATSQRQTFYDTLVGTVVVRYRRKRHTEPDHKTGTRYTPTAFTLPFVLQNQAFLWQRYYKLLTRTGHGGEHASRYTIQQAQKELIRRLPLMQKHLPTGNSAGDLSGTDTVLRLFSDSLDRNEVRWENR